MLLLNQTNTGSSLWLVIYLLGLVFIFFILYKLFKKVVKNILLDVYYEIKKDRGK